MSGVEFWQTMMGRQLVEGTLPRIANSLVRLADAAERLVDAAGKPPSVDAATLDGIAAVLSGKTWDPSTLDEVAELVRSSGRKVREA